MTINRSDLYNKKKSEHFYEDRYLNDYMEKWPNQKKQRVFEVIKSLHLPIQGECLDFGCGNGVFTDIIRKALPLWTIYGCDISNRAIEKAAERYPKCIFFVNNHENFRTMDFDFIFSHHVLEHVFDIKEVAAQINQRAKNSSAMLHIFPCGNPGSYEYKLCKNRIDGINTKMENRFFFEDEGHLRRLTTKQCTQLFKEFNFDLKDEFYSTQYHGAINWITKSNFRFIYNMFNPIKGKNVVSSLKLFGMLFRVLIIAIIRHFVIFYDTVLRVNDKKNKHKLFLYLLKFPLKVSKYFDDYIESLAVNEWIDSKTKKNGSEMFLFFTR